MAKKKPAKKSKPAAAKRRGTPVLPKVAAASDVPAIGQPWPGSKDIRIAEIKGRNGAPNYHLLLVCDKAGKPVVLESREWGKYGQSVAGADSRFDGLANTEAMRKADNALAKEVRKHGQDAYLPAIFELQALGANNDGFLPIDSWWWSSTQLGASYARSQNFEYGYSYWSGKYGKFHACVVRRVLIQ